MIDISLILSLLAVFLLAGVVKGTAGLGLPMTALGLSTLFLAPRTAIAVLLFPLLLTNAWQVYRSGDLGGAIKRYWLLIVVMVIVLWLTVMVSAGVDDQILLAFLGISILCFVAFNITKIAPQIPSKYDRLAQVIAGSFAGIFGGFTSVWAPPLAIYLTARDVKKQEFVRASGLIFFLGSVPLVLGYVRQGYLTADLSMISALMLIPTFAGFWLGERLRGKMSEQSFRKLILFVFFLMGLNLLRRAIFGA